MATFTPQPPGQLVLKTGKNPLRLGAITFSTEETPAKWNIGASEQMQVVTDLPGGGRIVQDFGNSAAEIRWTAKFMGPNIPIRVNEVRSYQVSGAQLLLSWGQEQYIVQIKSFDPGYMGGYNEYDIVCTVIQDQNGAFKIQTPASVDQQVANLQSQAQIQQSGVANSEPQGTSPTGDSVYGQALINLWLIIQAAAPLSQNIVQFGPQILTAAQTAISAIQQYQAGISQSSPQYPYTVGLLSSVQTIVANVQSGTVQTSVTVPGGELFSTASLYYGDITQAFSIAQANSMVYPVLPTSVVATVSIPPKQQAA